MLGASLGESDDPTCRGRNFHCAFYFRTEVRVCPGIQINTVAEIIEPTFRHEGGVAFKLRVKRLVSVTAQRTDNVELPYVPWRFGGDGAAICYHADQHDKRDCPRAPRLSAFCVRLSAPEAARLALQRRSDSVSSFSSD